MRRKCQLIQLCETIVGNQTASSKAPADAIQIALACGFLRVQVFDRKSCGLFGRLANRIIWVVSSISLLIRVPIRSVAFVQFPSNYLDGRLGFFLLYALKRLRDVQIITLVHDINLLRRQPSRFDINSIRHIFLLSNIIIAHNRSMAQWIISQGVLEKNIVCLGVFDYLNSEFKPSERLPFVRSVTIAGNLGLNGKSAYVKRLREVCDVNWELYGPGFDNDKYGAENIHYHGSFSSSELPYKLKRGFGLVWDGDSIETCSGLSGGYLRYNNPHKVSLYIASGLPIIVWRQSALREFVEKNRIGIAVDSLYELSIFLRNLSAEEYQVYRDNTVSMSKKVLSGEFLSRALIEALRRLGSCHT